MNGGTNRNMAIWGTTLIDAGADNMMYAVDARTGKLVWETKVLDPKLPARATAGPIVANGKVITGRQCQPAATNDSCIITAHDAATGKELWRTRTIPRKGEPGDETWGNVPMEQRWHVGTWMVPSYDPELDRIYIGTSVTIPAPKFILGGVDKQHLYHNSTLALDPATGKIVWYYQHLIDHWDLDHPFERLLVDTAVTPDRSEVTWINPRLKPGEKRKVITGIPGKTGIVYTLDRKTGEFLWARPTVFQNVVKNIDGATGKVTDDPERVFTRKDETIMVCPGTNGGKNWPAGAYSPRTNSMYMPMQNMCMNATVQTGERDPSLVYGFKSEYIPAPGADKIGVVWGISAETGKTRLQARAARRRDVAGRYRRRARFRRRRRRQLPRARRQDGRSAVGDEHRFAGQRLSDQLRGRRQAVRGRDDGAVARRDGRAPHDARAAERLGLGAGRRVRVAHQRARAPDVRSSNGFQWSKLACKHVCSPMRPVC